MENLTGSANVSNASSVVITAGPSPLIISLYFLGSWIILSNGLILLCLVLNRYALKNFVNLQILSLSVTDTLVGVSVIPVTASFHIVKSFSNFGVCSLILYGYGVAQHATMHHAFAICIYRLVTIIRCRGRPEVNPRGMYKTLLMQVAFPWIESLVVVSIPYFVFGKPNNIIKVCSMNAVFVEDYINALILFDVNLIIPHVGMNIVYIYVLVFLLRKWKRIDVLKQGTGQIPKASGSISYTPQGSCATKTDTTVLITHGNGCDNDINSINPSTGRSRLGNESDAKDNTGPGTAVEFMSKSMNSTDKSKISGPTTHQQSVNDGKLGIRGQKDVLITIGLLLLVLNVFMTPITFFAVAEVFNASPLTRQTKFIMLLFPLMNSILNPFIYIFRIKPFREVLRDLWKRTCAKFGFKF